VDERGEIRSEVAAMIADDGLEKQMGSGKIA